MSPVRGALPWLISWMVSVTSLFVLPDVADRLHQLGISATSQSPSASMTKVRLHSVLIALARLGRQTSS